MEHVLMFCSIELCFVTRTLNFQLKFEFVCFDPVVRRLTSDRLKSIDTTTKKLPHCGLLLFVDCSAVTLVRLRFLFILF